MRFISLFLVLIFLSFNSYAGFDGYVEKPFSIGGGPYGSIIDSDDFSDEIEFSGIAISFGYAFSEQFAFRGTYFTLDEDDVSVLESEGFDFNVYLGTGFAREGLKAYIGGGLFKDEWSVGAASETLSGFQLSGGIGYHWESISLDYIINIRDPSDYEDLINDGTFPDTDLTVVTGTLQVSYRF